jgi:hypothetical protein
MKIKELEERIEKRIIESVGVLTEITIDIDDKKLTSDEKVKKIKESIDYFLRDFNKTFRMSQHNRKLVYDGVPELISDIEELKTSIAEYIIRNSEESLRYTKDIDDVFKDFE